LSLPTPRFPRFQVPNDNEGEHPVCPQVLAKEAGSTNPSVNAESSLESTFDQAYQDYNANRTGYGDLVIQNTKLYEPNPNGSIFNSGGQ
jgi:hypothetical protein